MNRNFDSLVKSREMAKEKQMWIVENKTPFAAAGTFFRNKDGAEVWVVAVKASFDILTDNTTRISEALQEVYHVPVYHGEPGASGLKYDMDLILDKPATDVILNGHAYAPPGKKVTKIEVAMKVAGINKRLIVKGNRLWLKTIGVSKTRLTPFDKMPLVYERTCGGKDELHKKTEKHGFDSRNPVGTGFAVKSSHRDEQKVPNIFYTDKKLAKNHTPACFGPIPCHWEPRVSYGGTYDEKWEQTRKPLLPDDFDLRFYQQTPLDQQVQGYLKGGETVELENLSPHGNVSFELPKLKPECITKLGKSYITHDPNLHTVIIEPDSSRLMMVWHTALECHNKEHLLEKTIVSLGEGPL